jgi:integrase
MKIAYTPMPTITLERVRDFFIFGSFTGMRYGDIAGLKKDNVFKDHIKFFNQKSGNTQSLTVPLTPVSKSILEKYKSLPGEYALPSISNQKTNDALKLVAQYAGIDERIEIANKDAFGNIKKEHCPKHDLVTCHTSRKSFITIAMTLGMPESTIVSITGHAKGSKAFHKYYDVVNQTKFTQMAEIFNR